MIKLYILYFVFGAFMLFNSLSAWIFSFFGVSALTYTGLFSSGVLFVIIPGLCLYNLKWASVLGLISLVGVLYFGVSELMHIYRFGFTWSTLEESEAQVYLGGIVWCIVTIIYSIKYIVIHDSAPKTIGIKKPAKLILAFLPLFLVVVFKLLDVFIK